MYFLVVFFFLLSFLLTWLVRIFAIRRAIIDIPNNRSSHSIPTPRGGGLAVGAVWFIGLTYLYISQKIDPRLFYALLAGLPLMVIGFLDDVFNLKPGIRFAIQLICAGTALLFMEGYQNLVFAGQSLHLPWLLTPLAFVAIIWASNLFNFLDGIDGYIGLEVVFLGLAIFLLTGNPLGLLLFAAATGFLCWNWQKAKIFMGDVGSTLLGFTIAVFAIYNQNNSGLHLSVWLILTSVFWFDATLTLFRRLKNKEHLSEAHRKHAYQRIVQYGYSHQRTTLWAFGINLAGFALSYVSLSWGRFDYVFLVVDLLLLIVILKWIDSKNPFEYNSVT